MVLNPFSSTFYLLNAPLHDLAQSDPTLTDWKIRCQINGESFIFDQWQPIYLKGFKPGQNWVQITLIDEQGEPIKNAFNSTVRLINYDPEQRDTLAQLTRSELSIEAVGQIVDPSYEPPVEVPEVPEVPEVAPEKNSRKNSRRSLRKKLQKKFQKPLILKPLTAKRLSQLKQLMMPLKRPINSTQKIPQQNLKAHHPFCLMKIPLSRQK